MYLCGVNAAKAIKQETLNKHCSPFAISVNIKNDKLIIRKIDRASEYTAFLAIIQERPHRF